MTGRAFYHHLVHGFFRVGLGLLTATSAIAFVPVAANAQDAHDHTPAVSGVPQGVP